MEVGQGMKTSVLDEAEAMVIVATNAFGLGIDVPDIRVVVHVGKIWALKDY
jgi:superfamily II DNA helicase RecQ